MNGRLASQTGNWGRGVEEPGALFAPGLIFTLPLSSRGSRPAKIPKFILHVCVRGYEKGMHRNVFFAPRVP